jgi:hypothetical protein
MPRSVGKVEKIAEHGMRRPCHLGSIFRTFFRGKFRGDLRGTLCVANLFETSCPMIGNSESDGRGILFYAR